MNSVHRQLLKLTENEQIVLFFIRKMPLIGQSFLSGFHYVKSFDLKVCWSLIKYFKQTNSSLNG